MNDTLSEKFCDVKLDNFENVLTCYKKACERLSKSDENLYLIQEYNLYNLYKSRILLEALE